LRYSVPKVLLPDEVLDQEIDRIRQAGVTFQMNEEIDSARVKELEQQYSAVIMPLEKAPTMAIKSSALERKMPGRSGKNCQVCPKPESPGSSIPVLAGYRNPSLLNTSKNRCRVPGSNRHRGSPKA